MTNGNQSDERAIFLAALEQAAPQAREAYLQGACAGNPDLLRRLQELLSAHEASQGPFDAPPPGLGEGRTIDAPRLERPGTADRPVQAAAANRRRRHGRRVHGRAARAGPPQGGAQDHQAGHGHAAGDRPLRGRAAGAVADGPSEHRPGARCRHDRKRPAVLRDGAGQGPADHRVLRRTPPDAPPAAGAVPAGLPGDPACPPERDHPPRHQAVEHPGGGVRPTSRCPR